MNESTYNASTNAAELLKVNFFNNFVEALKSIEEEHESEKKSIQSIIKSLIQKADEATVKYVDQAKVTKERFDVFNCLTRHHIEELHSNFIYYLLNPEATHDCGSLFLTLFIESLKDKEEILRQLEDVDMCLENVSIKREKKIGRSKESDIYGFIDLFIETTNLNIAIENKIKAGEQPLQIERYSKYCKEQKKKYIVLYLTLLGYHPNQSGEEVRSYAEAGYYDKRAL